MPKLYRLAIDKAALKSLPDRELTILLGGGKLLNEMNISTKHLMFCMNAIHTGEGGPDNSAAFTAHSFFMRTLAGHVYEAYKFFGKVVRVDELRKSKSGLLDANFYADVETLNKYFGRSNIIFEMRRKFSFHTDPDLLRKAFECLPAGFEYEALLGQQQQGHNVFYGSEITIIDGIQHLKPHTSWDEAIDALVHDTIRVATIITKIFQRIIGSILTERLKITMDDAELVSATDGPPINTVLIPFFCKPPTSKLSEHGGVTPEAPARSD